MSRKFVTGAMLLLAPTAMAVANPYETIVNGCEELPPVDASSITNSRGDQSALERNDQYTYDYAYRMREQVHLVMAEPQGKPETHDFFRLQNKTRQFRGDSVASVKNQAETYRRSRKLFTCEASAAMTRPAPPPMPPAEGYDD